MRIRIIARKLLLNVFNTRNAQMSTNQLVKGSDCDRVVILRKKVYGDDDIDVKDFERWSLHFKNYILEIINFKEKGNNSHKPLELIIDLWGINELLT